MTDEIFLSLIPEGAESRITSCEICSLTGIKGSEVRRIVNRLRERGEPIASDGEGYFIAKTYEELEHTLRQLDSRINAIKRARDGLNDAAHNLIFAKEG